jgi:hypothetical protein
MAAAARSVVGGTSTAAVPAKDTTPTLIPGRQVVHEPGRGLLRGGQPVRGDIGGLHGLSCFTLSGTFLSNYLARLTAMLTTRSMPLPARTRQRPVLSPDTRSDLVPFSVNKTCHIIRTFTPTDRR